MEVLVILFLMMVVSMKSSVIAQSGDKNADSVSIALQIRLPNENFIDKYNDKKSMEYMALQMILQENLKKEIEAALAKENIKFSSVDIFIKNFRNGSVIADFVVVIDGTSINATELFKIIQTASADSKIGTFTTEQIEDLNECISLSNNCGEFAECVNTVGSFRCVCYSRYFDVSGDGTECVTPVAVSCKPDEMIISTKQQYLESISNSFSQLRLNDMICAGVSNTTSFKSQFPININLTECGTKRFTNKTHVTYTNTLIIEPKSDGTVLTGKKFIFPLSCSYSKNINTSLSFKGVVKHANNSVQGNGSFTVDLKLYKTSAFLTEETKQEFATTDNLYVEGKLNANDDGLTVVLNRCWATPSALINDTEQYDIITDSCAESSAVDGSVKVISNGESMRSRFSVQVFVFLTGDTVYLHCGLVVCSSLQETCKPTCSSTGGRKRRHVGEHSVLMLGRTKRGTYGNREQEKTVGPFYRKVQSLDVRFWATAMSLVTIVIILLLIVTYLVLKYRERSMNTVIALKMRNLEMDNLAYS